LAVGKRQFEELAKGQIAEISIYAVQLAKIIENANLNTSQVK
jgi:hypothetical protein